MPDKLKPNVFTSRSPRDKGDIHTCIAMLEDSPFWDREYSPLLTRRHEIVEAWAELLSGQGLQEGCRGYIDIIENESYNRLLQRTPLPGRRNGRYDQHFHSVWFVAYLTREFLREIIATPDIPDIALHFIQRLVEHRRNHSIASPVPSHSEIIAAHNRTLTKQPGPGLYCFSFVILHPEIDEASERFFIDLAPYIRCVWRSALRFHGGLSHHAWVNDIAGEFVKHNFERAGQKVYRPYPNNDTKPSNAKKFLLCMTKNMAVSSDLGMQPDADLTVGTGTNYSDYFIDKKPLARLTLKQQYTAYLTAMGYSVQQIAKVMGAKDRDITQFQRKASEKLYRAGYYFGEPAYKGPGWMPDLYPPLTRENLAEVTLENLHEVRSIIVPLYPWPQELFVR